MISLTDEIFIHQNDMVSLQGKMDDGKKIVRRLMSILLKKDIKAGILSIERLNPKVVDAIIGQCDAHVRYNYDLLYEFTLFL